MAQQQQSLPDNFNFELFGAGLKLPFKGYISAVDPTTVGPGVLIGGSVNTFKALTGAIYNRAGLKRRGPADNTQAGIVSSYEWENSFGATRVLRAVNGNLQVEFVQDDGTIEYFDLLTGLSDAEMEFSFTPWYSQSLGQDLLVFVNGKQQLNAWSGGLIDIVDASNDAGIIGASLDMNDITAANLGQYASGGIDYVIDDELTLTGGDGNAVIVVDSVVPGGVKTVGVGITGSGGSGYTVGDLIKVGAGTTQALLKVTTAPAGVVTGLAIVTPGVGNSIGSNLATTNVLTSGSPSGLTVNIASLGNTISNYHFKDNGATFTASTIYPTTGGSGAGATVYVSLILTGRVTVGGPYPLYAIGFPGALSPTNGTLDFLGGTFVANGVPYTYTCIGDDGFSFIGVSPDPTGIVGEVAISQVTVTDTSATSTDQSQIIDDVTYYQARLELTFFNDAVVSINNQIYLLCYASRLVHVSSVLNYAHYDVDYLATGVLRSPGFPDLLTLDTNGRAASARDGDAVVFGSMGDSYLITRVSSIYNQDNTDGDSVAFAYEQVTIEKQLSSDLSSPQNQNFISSLNDSIIFFDDNNQLRQFGTLRNLNTPVYPIFSLDVYTELAHEDFTGGMLRVVAEQSGESVYITQPLTGKLFIYQIRYNLDSVGNLAAERLWQPPFVVGCSTVAVIDGITYVYSNTNPQLYQLWDTGQYYDDGPDDGDMLPYSCHAVTSYLSLGITQQMSFDKEYFEGYMTRGTPLYASTYLDYQGAKGIQVTTINNPVAPGIKNVKFYGAINCPNPGDSILGNIEIGDGIIPPDTQNAPLAKFRAIRRVTVTDVFEAAIDIWSEDIDAQWGILRVGANLQASKRQPTGIMGILSN